MDLNTTVVNAGKTGAKRQSWKDTNPRSILIKIIAENPHESREDEENILELFWHAVKADEEILRTICEYWGINNYRSIVYKADERMALQRAEEVERAKRSIAAKIILLDWKLPNGKALRDCTKEDCRRQGGWLIKVASKLKARQRVGDVFSESQLRSLLHSLLGSGA